MVNLLLYFTFLALADEPTVVSKVVYVNMTVITYQAECSECYVDYYNHIYNSVVDVCFGPGYNLSVQDTRFERVKDATYSFVVEKLELPNGSKDYDCLKSSSPSLQHLITSCRGSVRAREITQAERVEALKFRYNLIGKSIDALFF